MARKQKITRKELLKKPDEFITVTARVLQWAAKRKKQLVYSLVAVVGLALLVATYQFAASRSERTAFRLLAENLAKYEDLRSEQDPEKAYEAVSEKFQRLINQYGGNDGGRLTRVAYANICFEAGRYQEAIDLYERALSDFEGQPLIRNLILSGLGYAHEQLKDFETAVKFFDRLAHDPKVLMPDAAWFNLGCLYAELGETEKSRQAFQKILSDYRDSMYYEMVKERLGESSAGLS